MHPFCTVQWMICKYQDECFHVLRSGLKSAASSASYSHLHHLAVRDSTHRSPSGRHTKAIMTTTSTCRSLWIAPNWKLPWPDNSQTGPQIKHPFTITCQRASDHYWTSLEIMSFWFGRADTFVMSAASVDPSSVVIHRYFLIVCLSVESCSLNISSQNNEEHWRTWTEKRWERRIEERWLCILINYYTHWMFINDMQNKYSLMKGKESFWMNSK